MPGVSYQHFWTVFFSFLKNFYKPHFRCQGKKIFFYILDQEMFQRSCYYHLDKKSGVPSTLRAVSILANTEKLMLYVNILMKI